MQTRRILIVDDAPEFANLVKDALATMQIPLQVTVYLSGEEAWLEVLKTRFDLVITDLRLPGISGTELIRRIRQRFPKIKIIAVSGLAEAGLTERTRAAGVDAFYRKPIELPLLMTKIDNLLSDLSQEETDDRPTKAQLVSRLVTAPIGLTPPARESAPEPQKPPKIPDVPKSRISPEDLASMKDLEQRLLKLLKESGAQGMALTTMTGQILYSKGIVEDYKFSSELIDASSILIESLKRVAHQPEETTTLGMLSLSGRLADMFMMHIGKFFVWLFFASGIQSAEAGKAAAAFYGSRDSLQFILNLLALLPVPKIPHPPVETEETRKERLATLNTDELKLEKAASKPADNKSVDDFWEAGSAEKTKAENPETIDFDKAASMGLIPSEHPKK